MDHHQQQHHLHDHELNTITSNKKPKKKNTCNNEHQHNNNNKKRFSDEQIKSMEIIFESQSKLEPRKKLQLARELELHPRQIAIWFQNKRARYKSKQLERDYNLLRDSYDSLASRFDLLNKEKHALAIQLEKLKKEMEMVQGETEQSCKKRRSCGGGGGFSINDENEEESIKAEYIIGLDDEDEEATRSLVNMVESVDGSFSCSNDDWKGLGTDNLFDESGSSYQWWDRLP